MKVKVWKRTDGGISVTRFNWALKFGSETDEEFIERMSAKVRLLPNLAGAEESVVDESNLPVRDENRDKWRKKPNGKIEVDPSVILPREIKEAKRTAAKNKLKTGQPLNDEDIEALYG